MSRDDDATDDSSDDHDEESPQLLPVRMLNEFV